MKGFILKMAALKPGLHSFLPDFCSNGGRTSKLKPAPGYWQGAFQVVLNGIPERLEVSRRHAAASSSKAFSTIVLTDQRYRLSDEQAETKLISAYPIDFGNGIGLYFDYAYELPRSFTL